MRTGMTQVCIASSLGSTLLNLLFTIFGRSDNFSETEDKLQRAVHIFETQQISLT
jgi:hypothetical protein